MIPARSASPSRAQTPQRQGQVADAQDVVVAADARHYDDAIGVQYAPVCATGTAKTAGQLQILADGYPDVLEAFPGRRWLQRAASHDGLGGIRQSQEVDEDALQPVGLDLKMGHHVGGLAVGLDQLLRQQGGFAVRRQERIQLPAGPRQPLPARQVRPRRLRGWSDGDPRARIVRIRSLREVTPAHQHQDRQYPHSYHLSPWKGYYYSRRIIRRQTVFQNFPAHAAAPLPPIWPG